MAPTTFLGMKTATTPYGRDPRLNGYPYKIAEMMAHLDGATYITRQSVHTPANVRKCKACDPQGVREFDGRQRFFARGGRFDLQQRLETLARGFERVARTRTCCPSIRWAISRT